MDKAQPCPFHGGECPAGSCPGEYKITEVLAADLVFTYPACSSTPESIAKISELAKTMAKGRSWVVIPEGYKLEARHHPWISCKDKLPPLGVDVLIVVATRWEHKPTAFGMFVAKRTTIQDDKFDWTDGEGYWPTDAVDHWMPLPVIPEDAE